MLIGIFLIFIFGLFCYNQKLKVNLVNDSDNLYEVAIDYLREKEFKENPDAKEKDFNVFYSYHGFGIERKIIINMLTCGSIVKVII